MYARKTYQALYNLADLYAFEHYIIVLPYSEHFKQKQYPLHVDINYNCPL